MHHADVYRLERMAEVADLALGELLDDDDGVVLVEWGDVVASSLGAELLTVRLEPAGPDARRPGAHDRGHGAAGRRAGRVQSARRVGGRRLTAGAIVVAACRADLDRAASPPC